MYYCGLKIGEEINTAVIIDDKAILMGNNIYFHANDVELNVFIDTLKEYKIDKTNLMICMDFNLITGYKNAYFVYEFFKNNGWDIRIKNYNAVSERTEMVVERIKVDTDTHMLAKFLKYNRDNVNLFMNKDLNIAINFSKNFIYYAVLYIIILILSLALAFFSSLNRFDDGGIAVNGIAFVFALYLGYYLYRSAYNKYRTKLPYVIFSCENLKILDTSYNGACKEYFEPISWKDISKIEKYIFSYRGTRVHKIYLTTSKQRYEIVSNGTNIKFKVLCKLVNFYWVNFSGRYQDKSQLIEYNGND